MALTSDGKASIALRGYMPPPQITYRYPSIDRTRIPLQSQTVVRHGTWYTDNFPPDGFAYIPSHQYRYDTLALTAGPKGQPGARARIFKDESLRNETYNWQGMKYTHNAFIDLDNGVVATASLFVPEEWVVNSPGSQGCVIHPSECAVATEVTLDLGYGPTGSRESLFRLHMGFDNRDEAWRDYGPFVYMYLDGPLTKQLGVEGVWPFSPLGTLLAFAFPGPVPRKVEDWRNIVRLNGWNDFYFSVRRISGDSGIHKGVRRDCKETAKIEWYEIVILILSIACCTN